MCWAPCRRSSASCRIKEYFKHKILPWTLKIQIPCWAFCLHLPESNFQMPVVFFLVRKTYLRALLWQCTFYVLFPISKILERWIDRKKEGLSDYIHQPCNAIVTKIECCHFVFVKFYRPPKLHFGMLFFLPLTLATLNSQKYNGFSLK